MEEMNPTDCKLRVDFSKGALRPKQRCKPAEAIAIAATIPLTIPSFQRMPRMKRSARPHPQVWVRPSTTDATNELKSTVATNVEKKTPVAKLRSSPPSFAILRHHNTRMVEYLKTKTLEIFYKYEPRVRRYNTRVVEPVKAKALELFYKYEPRVLIKLRRIGTLAVTLASTIAALRGHGSPKL